MQEVWDKYKGLVIWFIILGIFILMIYLLNNNKENTINRRIDDGFLKDYKINEVIKVYVTDEDLAKKYLSDYVNMLLYHREEAFKLVDSDTLVEKFIDYNSFNNYVKNLVTDSFIKATVKSYNYGIDNGRKSMKVIDIDGNVFEFYEESLMNYTVSL